MFFSVSLYDLWMCVSSWLHMNEWLWGKKMSNRFVSNLTGSSMLEIFLVVSTLSVRNPCTLFFWNFFFFCFRSTTRFSEFMNFIAQFYLFHQSNRFSYLISGFVSSTSCNWLQKWIWWSILFCCRICKINSLFFVFLLEAYGTSFKFLMLLINFMLRIVDYTVLSHIMLYWRSIISDHCIFGN